MRKLLILAFLLYDFVAITTKASNYDYKNDYDDTEGMKRHSMIDDRRNWRKKALQKPGEDHRDWDRKRYDYDNMRYPDDMDAKNPYNGPSDRQHDMDLSSNYRQPRKYDDADKMTGPLGAKSSEHLSFPDKEEKKVLASNCERPHERYEACFAGCASVTCDNPRDRMQPCYPFCEAGCVCVHPYVRDDRTHKCVLPEECTKGLKGIPDLGDDLRR